MPAPAERKKGGGVFGGAKFAPADGKREPGKFKKFDQAATVAKLGTKTTSDGFARGGAKKRASGGSVDEDGIGRDPSNKDDGGRKAGGVVARKAGGAIGGASSAPSLAKRARGGRTSAPFSAVHMPAARHGSSDSGHEGE